MSLREHTVQVPFRDGTGAIDFLLDAAVFPQGIAKLDYKLITLRDSNCATEPVAMVTFEGRPTYWAQDHHILRARVIQPDFSAALLAGRRQLRTLGAQYGEVTTSDALRMHFFALYLAGTIGDELLRELHLDAVKWHRSEQPPEMYYELTKNARKDVEVKVLQPLDLARSA